MVPVASLEAMRRSMVEAGADAAHKVMIMQGHTLGGFGVLGPKGLGFRVWGLGFRV